MVLDARLEMLARMIEPCGCVADIGADHGYLGIELLLRGKCSHVQLLDVSEASLGKARQLACQLGLMDRVSFGVGDGAEALARRADCAVIAGMGGRTIAGILERGRDTLAGAQLVLQPNRGAELVRRTLTDLGYAIRNEQLARAGGRWYVGMAARAGAAEYSQAQLIAGPILMERGGQDFLAYAAYRQGIAQKALAGAQRGNADPKELTKESKVWEEILHAGCSGTNIPDPG